MYERIQGEKSPWQPYLKMFPQSTLSPLLWTPEEQQRLLKGSPALGNSPRGSLLFTGNLGVIKDRILCNVSFVNIHEICGIFYEYAQITKIPLSLGWFLSFILKVCKALIELVASSVVSCRRRQPLRLLVEERMLQTQTGGLHFSVFDCVWKQVIPRVYLLSEGNNELANHSSKCNLNGMMTWLLSIKLFVTKLVQEMMTYYQMPSSWLEWWRGCCW